MNEREIEILIISNKYDYSTDFICLELDKRNISYFRLNRDCFFNKKVFFDVLTQTLEIQHQNINYIITEKKLRSIYYRAPTYLRETFMKEYSTEKQLYNSQWMSFVRNLTFFDKAIWINNPNYIYKAENKILQLKYALQIGFNIPYSIITNYEDNLKIIKRIDTNKIVVKGLDTVLFKINNKEAFFYTNVINKMEIQNYDLSLCPVVLQNYLYPKIDIRVTVINTKLFAVKIVNKKGKGVEEDWRRFKDEVCFVPINLPKDIENKCFEIIKLFNLKFAGIDLILFNNRYYFIELNPTGEWGWLVKKSKLPIQKEIVKCLLDL